MPDTTSDDEHQADNPKEPNTPGEYGISDAIANTRRDAGGQITPPPGTSAPLGTHVGNEPSHSADFESSQAVEGGVNENPAHWGASTDAQLGGTGKTSTDGDLTDDTSNLRKKSE